MEVRISFKYSGQHWHVHALMQRHSLGGGVYNKLLCTGVGVIGETVGEGVARGAGRSDGV